MDRTNAPNNIVVGGKRQFRDRDLDLGQRGTIVNAAHMNAVQEELLGVIEAAGLTPSASNQGQLLEAIPLVTPGRLVGVQPFFASGTYTPTPGATSVEVHVQGGGGGAGGAPATGAGQVSAGAPGSAGAYSWGRFAVTGPLAVTVGAGGAGGVGLNGSPGGASSIGPITAPGGAAGAVVSATSVLPIIAGNTETAAGTGGIINAGGPAGQPSMAFSTVATQTYGGAGGNSRFGAGGGTVFGSIGTGRPGVGYGAGGGGTANGESNANQTGGAGAPGLILVIEWAE